MKTVLCHGVFDVLHAGHLKYFQAAKRFGDYLIVSVTTDRFVNKGPGRPYFNEHLRAEMVGALGVVDKVIISDHPTAVNVINETKPDFYAKGPDYKDLTKDVTGEIVNEKAAVEAHGGKLVFTDDETFSSGTIINRFFQSWTDGQRSTIESVQTLGGITAVTKAVDEISKVKVLVVGEPILDIYRFCTPEGISSKSPSISARFNYEETYYGGAMAIERHLRDFAKEIFLEVPPMIPPKKIRYITADKQQRVFEITHDIQDNFWKERDPTTFIEYVHEHAKKSDVVILADFGHGLFEGPVLDALDSIRCFVGLNVQTNSSNYGFNLYDKHSRFDYLCLDTKEARLAESDRYATPIKLARLIAAREQVKLGLTVGPSGAYLISKDKEYSAPAFTDGVVDATGAGDAYFAITTCLLKTGCNEALIPFIGNVFAGLKTKIIGNKASVSKADLLKACSGILK